MEHLIQYSSKIEGLFFNYIKEYINLHELINGLEKVQYHCRIVNNEQPDSDKELWFRLYKGDTAATSINDLYTELLGANRQQTIEAMKTGISLGNSVQIFYS